MAQQISAFLSGYCAVMEAIGVRERGIGKFKSVGHVQRFLRAHAAVSNLFNLGRYKIGSQHYRDLRISAFYQWRSVAA
jgi:putative transposase